jgi:hypothetical protein
MEFWKKFPYDSGKIMKFDKKKCKSSSGPLMMFVALASRPLAVCAILVWCSTDLC